MKPPSQHKCRIDLECEFMVGQEDTRLAPASSPKPTDSIIHMSTGPLDDHQGKLTAPDQASGDGSTSLEVTETRGIETRRGKSTGIQSRSNGGGAAAGDSQNKTAAPETGDRRLYPANLWNVIEDETSAYHWVSRYSLRRAVVLNGAEEGEFPVRVHPGRVLHHSHSATVDPRVDSVDMTCPPAGLDRRVHIREQSPASTSGPGHQLEARTAGSAASLYKRPSPLSTTRSSAQPSHTWTWRMLL